MIIPQFPTAKQLEARIRKMEREKERAERAEAYRPEREFMLAAVKAGFKRTQAAFMWEWLATKDHQHWDGRVG